MSNDTFKCGFVSIVGRPNVGKSTLLNSLLGNKISIVSRIPQTTRYQIRGILNQEGVQVVFVDTPGIHSFKDTLAKRLNTIASKALQDIELILYVVDVSRSVGREEFAIMDRLIRQPTNIIMVLNKIDTGAGHVNEYIEEWKERRGQKKISRDNLLYFMPVSAKTGKNLEELKETVINELPVHPPFYDPESLTDFPEGFRVADMVREKLFHKLKDELPHSLAVQVEEIEHKEHSVYVEVLIYIERRSQKSIVIGKGGNVLKEVGIEARKDLEAFFKKKVFVALRVKVVEDWQKSTRILRELGYGWT